MFEKAPSGAQPILKKLSKGIGDVSPTSENWQQVALLAMTVITKNTIFSGTWVSIKEAWVLFAVCPVQSWCTEYISTTTTVALKPRTLWPHSLIIPLSGGRMGSWFPTPSQLLNSLPNFRCNEERSPANLIFQKISEELEKMAHSHAHILWGGYCVKGSSNPWPLKFSVWRCTAFVSKSPTARPLKYRNGIRGRRCHSFSAAFAIPTLFS